MMATIQTGIQSVQTRVKQWGTNPRVYTLLRVGIHMVAGFALAAASLANYSLPLAAGAVCGLGGWQAALVALGSAAGYMTYWGSEGVMGLVWVAAALIAALALGDRQITKATPLLQPAIGGLIAAGSGLGFRLLLGDTTPFGIYLLRILIAAAATALARRVTSRRDPVCDWLACGFWVLALAQAIPLAACNAGFLAAGFLAAGTAFPPAALAGLALDLAQISSVPMTAVLSMAWLSGLSPGRNPWLRRLAPAASYWIVMSLFGIWEPWFAVALAAGGVAGIWHPRQALRPPRQGSTGAAQVRLEMAAGVMTQTAQILLEVQQEPLDERSLLQRCTQAACDGCPCRENCQDRDAVQSLSPQVLHRDLTSREAVGITCGDWERVLQQLQWGQEQLRLRLSCRARQQEYTDAVIQQYGFLSQYLQGLSDSLSQHRNFRRCRFQPQVRVYANRRERENGDRCSWFAGTENRYYIVLCDGMGTGPGAVAEGNLAMNLLKKLLCAGYPGEYALRSINSLCALRGQAGAVTVDVAELNLDTGKATLYKWGAAPSWLLCELGAEKIGTTTPPPGLSVLDGRETVERVSLRRGETLVLLSDGVGGEDAYPSLAAPAAVPLGEVAAQILAMSDMDGGDDATFAVIRLTPA